MESFTGTEFIVAARLASSCNAYGIIYFQHPSQHPRPIVSDYSRHHQLSPVSYRSFPDQFGDHFNRNLPPSLRSDLDPVVYKRS